MESEPLRIAVTGGAGFIGSHLVDRLVTGGHDVAVVDLRAPHRSDVTHHRVDINDLDASTDALAAIDVVFHLAAVSNVNDVLARPTAAVATNIGGTANVWEAARRNGVRRAVLASTVWVYSAATGDGPFDEDWPLDTNGTGHLYTSTKLAAEMVARNYLELYGQEYTVLRYGIPFGPRMRPELALSTFVDRALRGLPLVVNGDGRQFRNYVYVDDLCEAHVLALADAAGNRVFNLEGREPISVRDLVDAVGTVLGEQPDVEYLPARTGEFAGRSLSAGRSQKVLGWTPTTPFLEGVRRVVDHVRSQQALTAAVSG